MRAIAQRLSERLRQQDTLARLGGDEFLIVLEGLQRPEEAATVAQTLIGLLTRPFTLLSSDQEIHLGASIGISLYPDDGLSVGELIQHADTTAYQAKAKGRNTYKRLFDLGANLLDYSDDSEMLNSIATIAKVADLEFQI